MYFNDNKKDTNIDSEFQKLLHIDYIKIIYFAILFFILGVILYFSFKNGMVQYHLDLLGNVDYVIYMNSEYIDPGYIAYDNKGNDFHKNVVISGIVDTKIAGEYIITYKFNDIVKTRSVNVLSNENNLKTYIVLNGEKIVYLNKGQEYIEDGYSVIDSSGVDLTSRVVIDSNLDINKNGSYLIKYSVKNNYGIVVNNSRTVIVMDSDAISINSIPSEYTNGIVTLNIGIIDPYFDYIVMPNGEVIYDRYSSYIAKNNGVYNFIIYNKNGDARREEYIVSNIDNVKPYGSCNGYYKNGKSYVTVNSGDDYSGVYKYVSDDQTFYNNNIVFDREYSKVNIILYDVASNSEVVSCSLENKNDIKNISYVKCRDDIIYKGTKYSLTQKQKEKLAAMAYGEDNYSKIGLRAVISHMANLYESKKWSGAISSKTSFYEYISTTNWYSANTRKRKYNASRMKYIISIIDDVLVNGRRTIPLYVDEFDFFPNDINRAKNFDSYVKEKTLYSNKYGANNLTFWCFSLNSSGTSGNIYGFSNSNYRNYILNKG